MGHDRFYIAAVVAPRPTHVAFRIRDGELHIISGPASYEQIAEEASAKFPGVEFTRELPMAHMSIEWNGKTVTLEEMKSWHYIAFDRKMTAPLLVAN